MYDNLLDILLEHDEVLLERTMIVSTPTGDILVSDMEVTRQLNKNTLTKIIAELEACTFLPSVRDYQKLFI
jgi:hypothetical protein